MKSFIKTLTSYGALAALTVVSLSIPQFSFARQITNQLQPSLPSVSMATLPVSQVGETTATLNGSVTFNIQNQTALVYFQYGKRADSLTYSTAPQLKNSNGTFSTTLSNLSSGTVYYVRAFASSNGEVVQSPTVLTFTTLGGGVSSANIQTLPPTSVTSNSAVLNAFVTIPQGTYTLYFKYGVNGSLTQNATFGSVSGTTGQRSYTVTGLSPQTLYGYKACIKDANNTETCATTSVQFTTLSQSSSLYECNDGIDNDNDGRTDYPSDSGCSSSTDDSEYTSTNSGSNDEPNVTTLSATNIDEEEATLRGNIESNGDTIEKVWFEWSDDEDNLNDDETVDEDEYDGNDSSFNVELDIDNLDNDTTYYFRVCAENSYGEDCGSIRSFTTDDTSSNNNNSSNYVHETPQVIPRIIYKTTTVGSTSSKIMLSIDTRFDNAYVGDTIDYVIEYKNISGQTLSNAILHVEFPNDVTFRRANEGRYNQKDNTLTLSLGTLSKGEHGEITVSVRAESSIRTKSEIVTKATLAFTLPNSAQDNAIAYAITKVSDAKSSVSGNALTGIALFGGDGFLPDSLIEWLILTILIVIMIAGFRYYKHKPETI